MSFTIKVGALIVAVALVMGINQSFACDEFGLRLAAQTDNFARLNHYFAEGCTGDSNTDGGQSIIAIAAMSGSSIYTLDYLMQHGANPNRAGATGGSLYGNYANGTDKTGMNIITAGYVDALKKGEKDPIAGAFARAHVIFNKNACTSLHSYEIKALYINDTIAEQKPELIPYNVIEMAMRAPESPQPFCPSETKHYYFDTAGLKLSNPGMARSVTGLTVYCCKE